MAKNNAVDLDIDVNADGFAVGGGTTQRKLTVDGGDVTITGETTPQTFTFPPTSATLVASPVTPEHTQRLQMRTVTASTTIEVGDIDDTIKFDSASALILTVPHSTSVSIPVGTTVEVLRWGTGAVTISPEASVNIYSSDATTGARDIGTQYGSAFLRVTATDEWHLSGDLI